ncbi:hypothetical protein [Spirosoma sp. KNUC1025]|uniref:hypothetical protein n=1 Tax=Spirosoma sp. KNUC1025 TaxID=2894082 RepID=UPI0038655D32|nr:hypothetical protein LN737_21620 [Spirosoma sp. KNUC1025]
MTPLYEQSSWLNRENKRTLRVVMGKNRSNVRQEASWLSGLLAVWLLVSVPDRATLTKLITEHQTYVSSLSLCEQSDESDYSSTANVHAHAALVYSSPGFVFNSLAGFLTNSRCYVPKIWRASLSVPLKESHFIFGLLHLIFEHQIAINAP